MADSSWGTKTNGVVQFGEIVRQEKYVSKKKYERGSKIVKQIRTTGLLRTEKGGRGKGRKEECIG